MFPKKYDFQNVLILPRKSGITSRSLVDLERTFHFKNGASWTGVPIVASNMDTIGTFEMNKQLGKHKCLTAIHKYYKANDFDNAYKYDKENMIISTGIGDQDYERLVNIMDKVDCKWICIDIANGYLITLDDFCRKVREKYPDKIIIAGNVVTPERTLELVTECGVDIVKLGIGPGSACLTRAKTGIGVPQMSTIMDCAIDAQFNGGFVMADGGITCPGDMAKAFCGGADFVMCGGVFAGHDECGGELIEDNGKQYKLFYGMSSELAQEKHYGKMNHYRTSEGRVLKVPYRGAIEHTIQDYLGGIRSTCTYINARNIEDMSKNASFVEVQQQLNKFLV